MVQQKNILITTISEVYEDLCKAKGYLADIIGSIQYCLDAGKNQVNLTEHIGIYAQQVPQLKFLNEKVNFVQSGIRMICSGELSLEKGLVVIEQYMDMVDEAIACFNVEAIDVDTANKEVTHCEHNDCSCGGNCKCNCKEQPEDTTDCDCEVTCEADSEDPNYGEDATDESGCDFELIIKGSKEDVMAAINRIM